MSSDFACVGIDVSKAELAVFVDSTARSLTVPNDADGIAAIIKELAGLDVRLIVIEHSGGYERRCWLALMDAGLPVSMVNPRQSRDFARAISWMAKNDAIDARLLAEFARRVEPRQSERTPQNRLVMDELVGRRRQLVAMRAAEQTRAQQAASKVVGKSISKSLRQLDSQIQELERQIASMIKEDDDWRECSRVMRAIPGVGPVLASTLIAELPELGRIGRQQIGSLVGVAPFVRESGKWKGKRSCFGGRAQIRKVLFMATTTARRCNPVIRALGERLKAAGKPYKVVMVACMRKLLLIINAIVASGQPWESRTTPNA